MSKEYVTITKDEFLNDLNKHINRHVRIDINNEVVEGIFLKDNGFDLVICTKVDTNYRCYCYISKESIKNRVMVERND